MYHNNKSDKLFFLLFSNQRKFLIEHMRLLLQRTRILIKLRSPSPQPCSRFLALAMFTLPHLSHVYTPSPWPCLRSLALAMFTLPHLGHVYTPSPWPCLRFLALAIFTLSHFGHVYTPSPEPCLRSLALAMFTLLHLSHVYTPSPWPCLRSLTLAMFAILRLHSLHLRYQSTKCRTQEKEKKISFLCQFTQKCHEIALFHINF